MTQTTEDVTISVCTSHPVRRRRACALSVIYGRRTALVVNVSFSYHRFDLFVSVLLLGTNLPVKAVFSVNNNL